MYHLAWFFITIVGLLVLTPAIENVGAAPSSAKALELNAIVKEMGLNGETKGDVYRFSLPRTDLTVMLQGVKLRPGFALGTWIAFKAIGEEAVAHGDLVLTESEVGPVVAQLERDGIEITGLHNHLINESPRVMYLHFWGKGQASSLARKLKNAVDLTKTPIGKLKEDQGEEAFPESESILTVLRHKGDVKNAVLKVNIPRSEPIKMKGVDVPPSMGMATALNFQPTGDGKVVATGDFVMTREEVNRVAKAMTEAGITVTALHNHLIHESPNLYFMHFWANDMPDKVAGGLKACIDAMERGQ